MTRKTDLKPSIEAAAQPSAEKPGHSRATDEESRYTVALPANLDSTTAMRRLVEEFLVLTVPLEERDVLHVLLDARTGAAFCECHVSAQTLVKLSTIDVPLDPEEQGDYRANREIVADHAAFKAMKQDAKLRRSFSNIVVEFTTEFDPDHPLKVIGGQHRFEAIREASDENVNELHGLSGAFGWVNRFAALEFR